MASSSPPSPNASPTMSQPWISRCGVGSHWWRPRQTGDGLASIRHPAAAVSLSQRRRSRSTLVGWLASALSRSGVAAMASDPSGKPWRTHPGHAVPSTFLRILETDNIRYMVL
ncbi:unnamed protein product [Urochloa humidicola]